MVVFAAARGEATGREPAWLVQQTLTEANWKRWKENGQWLKRWCLEEEKVKRFLGNKECSGREREEGEKEKCGFRVEILNI